MRMLAFPARHKKLHKKDQFLMLHNLQVNLILQAVWCFLFQVGFISFIHKLVCSFVCLSRFGFLFFFFFFFYSKPRGILSPGADLTFIAATMQFLVWAFSFLFGLSLSCQIGFLLISLLWLCRFRRGQCGVWLQRSWCCSWSRGISAKNNMFH